MEGTCRVAIAIAIYDLLDRAKVNTRLASARGCNDARHLPKLASDLFFDKPECPFTVLRAKSLSRAYFAFQMVGGLLDTALLLE